MTSVQNNSASKVQSFSNSWLGMGANSNRRLMSVLRKAHRTLGISRKRLGLGMLGRGRVSVSSPLSATVLALLMVQGAPSPAFAQTVGTGANSVAIGTSANANKANTVAVGANTAATGTGATAIGSNTTGGAAAGATDSVAIGGETSVVAGATSGVALGHKASVSSEYSTAIGDGATAGVGSSNLAVGTSAQATGLRWNMAASGIRRSDGAGLAISAGMEQASGMAIGSHASSTGAAAMAIGSNANSTKTSALAVGNYSQAIAFDAVSVGTASYASGVQSLSFGSYTAVTGNRAAGIGTNVTASATDATAIGTNANAAGDRSIAFGSSRSPSTTTAELGQDLNTNTDAIGADSIAIGTSAQSKADNSIALGAGAVADRAGAVALGYGSVTDLAVATQGVTINGVNYDFAGTGPASTVSVGAVGSERTVTNVAAGRLSNSSTDAVNGSQLYAANQAVDAMGTQIDSLGSSAASTLGGGAAYSGGVWSPPSYVVQSNDYTTVGGALNAIDGSLSDLSTNVSELRNGAVGPVRYSNAATSTTPNGGTPSQDLTLVGVSTDAVGLHNVAAGNLSATSTDAVNGSQLYSTNQSVALTAENVGTIASALGGGAAVNGQGAVTGPVYALNGTSFTNVGDALSDLDGRTASNTADIAGNTGAISTLNTGLTATNAEVTGLGTRVTTAEDDISTLQSGFTTNSSNIAALQTDAMQWNPALNGGSGAYDASHGSGTAQKISNVAAGTAATDAVNVSQLENVAGLAINAVQYDGPSKTSLTLAGSGGTTVTNVAAGTVSATSSDAVNGSQLFATNQQVATNSDAIGALNSGLATTNTNVNALDNRLATTEGDITTLQGGLATSNSNIALLQAGALQWNPGLNGYAGAYDASHGSGTAQKIANVAAGTDATDAVNVSQLGAVASAANAGWNLTTAKSGSGTVSGTSLANVAPGATQTIVAGDNIALAQNGSELTIATNPDLIATSVTTGSTTLNTGGLTISGGPSVTLAGIDAGGSRITGVAAGALGAASADAVNGSQLFETNEQVAANTTTIAANTADIADNTLNITKLNTDLATTNDTITDLGHRVTTTEGDISTLQSDVAASTSNIAALQIDALLWNPVLNSGTGAYDASHGTGTAKRITNVAAASLSAASTDAVNGSQLYATNLAVAENTTNITNLQNDLTALTGNSTKGFVEQASAGADLTVGKDTDGANVNFAGTTGNRTLTGVANGAVNASSSDAINGSQLEGVSQSFASALGGGSVVNSDGTLSAPSYSVGGTTFNTVGGALTNLDQRTTTLEAGVAGLANGTAGLVQQENSSAPVTVAKGSGGNLVSVAGTDGNRVITGVADGLIAAGSTDAINGGQLNAATQSALNGIKVVADNLETLESMAVTYDNASKSSVTYNRGAGAVSLHNVAAGEVSATSSDAINGSQLYAVQQGSNTYTDSQVAQVRNEFGSQLNVMNNRIDSLAYDVQRNRVAANAGIASVAAMANIPQAINPGRISIGGGVGFRDNQTAFALGISGRANDDRTSFKASVGVDSQSVTVGLGIGHEL